MTGPKEPNRRGQRGDFEIVREIGRGDGDGLRSQQGFALPPACGSRGPRTDIRRAPSTGQARAIYRDRIGNTSKQIAHSARARKLASVS